MGSNKKNTKARKENEAGSTVEMKIVNLLMHRKGLAEDEESTDSAGSPIQPPISESESSDPTGLLEEYTEKQR